jgi:hypothetical protein
MKSLLPLLLLLATFAPTSAGANGITVSQSLDKAEIPFEDSVEFTITLAWPGPQSAYLIRGPLDPEFKKLKVSGFSSSIASTGTGPDEQTIKTYNYWLVPLSPGEARIEPLTVDYITYPDSVSGSLTTESMIVTIDTPEPVPAEGGGLPTVWVVVIIVVVVLGLGALIVFVRLIRRRDLGREIVKSPREIALEQVDNLRQTVGDDMKSFQAGLYAILTGYLQAQYGIRPDSLDDAQLAATIEELPLPEGRKETVSEWIIEARKDKFRPVDSPPGETVRRATAVRKFFEST